MFRLNKYITEALVLWAEDREGDWSFSLYVMMFKGEEIKLKADIGNIAAQDLNAQLEAYLHLPILLHIVGDGVFEKVIQGKKPVVSDVLGVRIENSQDFILQVFEEKRHSYYGCVIRKNTLDAVFQHIPAHTSRVVSLYLGCFLPAAFLASVIPHFQQRILIFPRQGKQFMFDKGEIVEDELAIGADTIALSNYFQGEKIEENRLEMYAHLLLLRISPAVCTLGDFSPKYQNFVNQQYKTKLFQIASSVLALLLAFFLIQFWLLKYESYQQGEQYAAEQPQLEKLKQNVEKIKGYEQLSHQFTSLNQSYASWMLDKFAHIKPPEVHFIRCVYHPTEEEWKAKEGNVTQETDFLIEGITPHSLEISTYVSKLEQLSFIKKVEVWDSQFDFQSEQHHFSLSIHCK